MTFSTDERTEDSSVDCKSEPVYSNILQKITKTKDTPLRITRSSSRRVYSQFCCI